jgi:hypothetical protein
MSTVPPLAESNRVKQPWTKTSETVSQNKSFLPTGLFSQVFCHRNKKINVDPQDWYEFLLLLDLNELKI